MTKLLATAMGYVLSFIYNLVNNYGISIVILTVLVRLLLLPLYNKQNKYTAAMAEIQPMVNEINTRYATDKEKQNEKLQELYQEHNVKPLSGCLPMLIQLPIIIGLFALLREPLSYITDDVMITAVHEGFLWVSDLSQPDNWILPIAAGITTYFSSALGSAGSDSNPSAKYMTYFFPVMIFLFGKSYPAGLALYWALGNLITMIQTWYFNQQKKKAKREKEIEEEVEKRLKRKNK